MTPRALRRGLAQAPLRRTRARSYLPMQTSLPSRVALVYLGLHLFHCGPGVTPPGDAAASGSDATDGGPTPGCGQAGRTGRITCMSMECSAGNYCVVGG